MARTFGKIECSAWRDPDWLSLPADAQWCYGLLVSQPEITSAGVLPLAPSTLR